MSRNREVKPIKINTIFNRSFCFHRRKKYLFIGDSHAIHFSGKELFNMPFFCNDREFCFPLGPRLMHTIAKRGFQIPRRFIIAMWASKFNTLVFCLGEIDCRVYLASNEAENYKKGDWVETYVMNSIKLSETLKIRNVVILSPVPPSDIGVSDDRYPRSGSLMARVSATRWMRDELKKLKVFEDSSCKLLDLEEILAGRGGSLDHKLTEDGVHVNNIGAVLVRNKISRLEFDTSSHLN